MQDSPRKNYLLLGAGFSRNWGGWLAAEVDEYLLGRAEIGPATRNVLLSNRKKGGFESALSELQISNNRDERLSQLLDALRTMFKEMNEQFQNRYGQTSNNVDRRILEFLTGFDAIFTLNQDLLLEKIYQNESRIWDGNAKWNGSASPGIKLTGQSQFDTCVPDLTNLRTTERLQPYFKLHGSSNWETENLNEILVMGGNKGGIISQFPLLKWYHDEFKMLLSNPSSQLLVIGYSFGDQHINKTISDAASDTNLKIFVIDPLGIDVLDKNRHSQIYVPSELFSDLWPNLIGASRRGLREIFGGDRVEQTKITQFFNF